MKDDRGGKADFSSDLSAGRRPQSGPNLRRHQLYPLYYPSIHTPTNFIFTKRRGTLWEPDPAAPLQPQPQQQQAAGPQKRAVQPLPLTADLLACNSNHNACHGVCSSKPLQRRWVLLLCGETHTHVRPNAQLHLPSTTQHRAPLHWDGRRGSCC